MSSKIRDLHYLKGFGVEFVETSQNQNAIKVVNFSDSKSPQSMQNSALNPQKSKIKSGFDILLEQVRQCELCHLSKRRKYALIEPVPKKAPLMLLYSHSDKGENELGFLKSPLKARLIALIAQNLGLSQDEFYLSYVYKCFNDNKVDDLAMSQCFPYFYSELDMVKPRFLLILGELAAKAVGLNDFKALRGELLSWHGTPCLASFDMNFLAKNPSLEAEFIKDLKKIKGFL